MWHEKKVIAWLLRDLTISRVHMQYKRLSPMPWYLPKARSLGIHRIHRPLYGANDRLIVVDTIGFDDINAGAEWRARRASGTSCRVARRLSRYSVRFVLQFDADRREAGEQIVVERRQLVG